jgi:hypothetical protein
MLRGKSLFQFVTPVAIQGAVFLVANPYDFGKKHPANADL